MCGGQGAFGFGSRDMPPPPPTRHMGFGGSSETPGGMGIGARGTRTTGAGLGRDGRRIPQACQHRAHRGLIVRIQRGSRGRKMLPDVLHDMVPPSGGNAL